MKFLVIVASLFILSCGTVDMLTDEVYWKCWVDLSTWFSDDGCKYEERYNPFAYTPGPIPNPSYWKITDTVSSIDYAKLKMPYLVYQEGTNLVVKKYSNASWSNIGTFDNLNLITPPQFDVFVKDDILYLLYQDSVDTQKFYTKNYSNSSWTEETNTLSYVTGSFPNPKILIDNNNYKSIVSSEWNHSEKLVIFEYDRSKTFEISLSASNDFYIDVLHFDSIVIFTESNGEIKLSGCGETCITDTTNLFGTNVFYLEDFIVFKDTSNRVVVKLFHQHQYSEDYYASQNPELEDYLDSISNDVFNSQINEIDSIYYNNALYVISTDTNNYLSLKKYEGVWSTISFDSQLKGYSPKVSVYSGVIHVSYINENNELVVMRNY